MYWLFATKMILKKEISFIFSLVDKKSRMFFYVKTNFKFIALHNSLPCPNESKVFWNAKHTLANVFQIVKGHTHLKEIV